MFKVFKEKVLIYRIVLLTAFRGYKMKMIRLKPRGRRPGLTKLLGIKFTIFILIIVENPADINRIFEAMLFTVLINNIILMKK